MLWTAENRGCGFFLGKNPLGSRGFGLHHFRKCYSKGQDLSIHPQKELDKIPWLLNSRQRKYLGWKCPAELFLPDFDFVKYYSGFFALRT